MLLRKGASVTALDSKGYNAALSCCPSDNVADCLALILNAMYANFAVSASSGAGYCGPYGVTGGVNGTSGYSPLHAGGVGTGGNGGCGSGVGSGVGYSSSPGGAVPPSLHNSFSLPLNLRNSLLIGGSQGPMGSLWGGGGSDGFGPAHSSFIGQGLACIPPHNKLSIHSTDSFSLRLSSPPPGGNHHLGEEDDALSVGGGVGVGLRNGGGGGGGGSGGGGSTSSSLGSQDALDMGVDGGTTTTAAAAAPAAGAFERNGSRQSPDNEFY